MITLAFWISLFVSDANAHDRCQAVYDAAYASYMSRQPQRSNVLEPSRIIRDANSPVHGQRSISTTGERLAAEAFARRAYQECQRNGQ